MLQFLFPNRAHAQNPITKIAPAEISPIYGDINVPIMYSHAQVIGNTMSPIKMLANPDRLSERASLGRVAITVLAYGPISSNGPIEVFLYE